MCLRQGVVLILILLLRGGLELLVVEHMHSKLGKHFKFYKKITFDFTFDMFLIFLWVDNEDNI